MLIDVKDFDSDNNTRYVELEGGLRLVIREGSISPIKLPNGRNLPYPAGKIDGWYFAGEKNKLGVEE